MDLFANANWYKGKESKEETFVGVLTKAQDKPGIGFARFNPYTLTLDGDTKAMREIFVGKKTTVLDDFVGKKVKIVGKAVNMEVEGREHREIWPATLELVKL